MTTYMRTHHIDPSLVLCSSARRARDTLAGVASAFGADVNVNVEEDLYGAEAHALLERIRLVPGDVESVMVIGHNPGLQDLASRLVGRGDGALTQRLADGLPTAALAVVRLAKDDWKLVRWGDGELVDLALPRELS